MAFTHDAPPLEKRLAEINQLIEFAEEVSAKVDSANEQIMRQTMYAGTLTAIVSIGAATLVTIQDIFAANSDRRIALYTGFIIIFIIGVIAARSALRMAKERKSLDVERRILGDLADMISSIFSSIEPEISAVDRALLSMRMRRISLSYTNENRVF